ncbi:PepSY domain-containing protein [Petrachloros mirabilis]
MKKSIIAACTAVSLAAFAGIALADKEQENLPKTAVTMEQAIKAVTDKFPGRVIESELEAEDGKAEYEITVVSASGESREFSVDGQTGQVSEDKETEKDEPAEKK